MNITIREAKPEDAGKLISYVTTLIEEPSSFLEMSKGEFTLTFDEEKKFIRECNESENSIFIVAEEKDAIIGNLICKGSNREKIKHVTSLGIAVKKEYRDRGIGTKLLKKAIDWAKGNEHVKRIELNVFETNKRAIHLYKKYGFVIEGKKKGAIFMDGGYINEIIMSIQV